MRPKPTQLPNLDKYTRPNGVGLSPDTKREIRKLHENGYDPGWISVYSGVKLSRVRAALEEMGITPHPEGSRPERKIN